MARKTYPDFHKSLLDQSVYPSAPRRIKFEESARSYLYRTGEHLYKVRKPSHVYSSLAIQEAFALEALSLGRRWAGDLFEAVVPIVRRGEAFAVGGEGEPVAYALRMRQLAGHYWLNDLVTGDKLTPTAVGRLARQLADQHEAHPAGEQGQEGGRPEHLRAVIEEVRYQTKKYIGQTITEAMYEMMARPIEKFLDEERKLFTRRIRKERIVDGHGAFVPEHIYLKGKEALVISPLEAQPKYRILDAANDVATLCNALSLGGADESADLFLKRYVAASRDRDLERILPIYEVLQALLGGLLCSERIVEAGSTAEGQPHLAATAQSFFNLAVLRVRELQQVS